MFAAFWQRYPQGSLTSDILPSQEGIFIVRSIVKMEEKVLASGLGSAATIEEAEDKARNRALAILDLPANSSQTAPPSSIPQTQVQQTIPQVTSPSSLSHSEQRIQDISPQPPVVETPISIPELELETTPLVTEAVAPLVEEEEVIESEPEIMTDPIPTAQLETPIDFSDVIARTNVELKRLGWTSEQGKDYLLATYGKRSRQLLTDEELVEFLHYLATQPSPS